jgi:hypothetical protein
VADISFFIRYYPPHKDEKMAQKTADIISEAFAGQSLSAAKPAAKQLSEQDKTLETIQPQGFYFGA